MLKRILSVGSFMVLAIGFTVAQAAVTEVKSCIPISVQEVSQENLEDLRCFDVEGWESEILIPAVRDFLVDHPQYEMIHIVSFGGALGAHAAAQIREMCPRCYFYSTLGGQKRMLLHLEKKREPRRIHNKEPRQKRSYTCQIMVWNTSRTPVEIYHPFDVDHVTLGWDEAVYLRPYGIDAAVFNLTFLMGDGHRQEFRNTIFSCLNPVVRITDARVDSMLEFRR